MKVYNLVNKSVYVFVNKKNKTKIKLNNLLLIK